MFNYSYYLNKVLHTPPQVLIYKLAKRLKNAIPEKKLCLQDLYFHKPTVKSKVKIKSSFIDINQLDISRVDQKVAIYLLDMYLDHRFDLLGSGWVSVDYIQKAVGLEGFRYDMNLEVGLKKDLISFKKVLRNNKINFANAIWKQVDCHYQPIDWQKDYKSGYRWSAKKWYKHQRVAPLPGADIKVPWELSRLQHLLQLAILALTADEITKNKCINEFKNQVLDFIATNPLRMGVNWTCTMDVGIRVANMLMAYDLFKQFDSGNLLNSDFDEIISQSAYEHGKFITENLEWSEQLTSNHYMANVAGLLFACAYLELTNETDVWLAFAGQELLSEIIKQFHEEGSNFEASTCYHRLSGEIVVISYALLCRIMQDKSKSKAFVGHDHNVLKGLLSREELSINFDRNYLFDNSLVNRIFGIGSFTAAITKANGEVPQVGDNDSGRFVKLSPAGKLISNENADALYCNLSGYKKYYSDDWYWDENHLDHRTLISFVAGFFNLKEFSMCKDLYPLEFSFIRALSNGERLSKPIYRLKPYTLQIYNGPQLSFSKTTIISLDKQKVEGIEGLDLLIFQQFGLFIFKKDQLQLTIMGGHSGQLGNGGHTHNDKLSFELYAKGENLVVDPGTYLYTPLPYRRDQFRSIHAHNTIIVDNQEQNSYAGLFAMKDEVKCSLIDVGHNFIKLYATYRGIHHIRSFEIENASIKIVDECNTNFIVNFYKEPFSSNGYGKKCLL